MINVVTGMHPMNRILYICFVALTIFSILSLGYSLFVTLEVSRGVRMLEVSLSDVDAEEDGSRVHFFLVVSNPSLIRLKVSYYSAETYLNDETIKAAGRPNLVLPANRERNFTITLEPEDHFTESPSVWRLNLNFVLETPLPESGSYKTVLEK